MQVGLSEAAEDPTAQAVSPVAALSLPSLHNSPKHLIQNSPFQLHLLLSYQSLELLLLSLSLLCNRLQQVPCSDGLAEQGRDVCGGFGELL